MPRGLSPPSGGSAGYYERLETGDEGLVAPRHTAGRWGAIVRHRLVATVW